jgi:hypothetical protein
MNLLFIELKPFTRAWRELGLELDELLAVQDLIGKQPGKYQSCPARAAYGSCAMRPTGAAGGNAAV